MSNRDCYFFQRKYIPKSKKLYNMNHPISFTLSGKDTATSGGKGHAKKRQKRK
jgi:hypothetical protein